MTRGPSTRDGLGAIPFDGGTTFRVWAPNAMAVHVIGTFNDWDDARDPLAHDPGDGGTWSADVPAAAPGDEYRFLLETPSGPCNRIDPRARRLTSSVGNGIVHDPNAFDWGTTHS